MNEVKLYNGEVTILFNEGSHRYTVNGEFVAGVTTILGTINKPLLMGWAAAMAAVDFKESVARALAEGAQINDKWLKKTTEASKIAYTKRSDKAKDLGHVVHSLIESYLLSGKRPLAPSVHAQLLVDNFIAWWGTAGYEVLGVEKVVYSRQYNYAGTYDIKLRHKATGRIVVVDNKTTKRSYQAQSGIYLEYPAQLGAYALADEEESGQKVDDLMLINPDKEYGQIQVVLMSELGLSVDQCKQAFLDVYAMYSALKPIEFRLKQQNTMKKGAWYAMSTTSKLDPDA